jgi:hypothetical protein
LPLKKLNKSAPPSFYMLPIGQKQNRKRKKRKGKREIEKSKGKTLKKNPRKKNK